MTAPRRLLATGGLAPGCDDALSAALLEQAGFGAALPLRWTAARPMSMPVPTCCSVEAPPSQGAMRAICDRFGARVPLLANRVEGGTTPLLDHEALHGIGCRLVNVPGRRALLSSWRARCSAW